MFNLNVKRYKITKITEFFDLYCREKNNFMRILVVDDDYISRTKVKIFKISIRNNFKDIVFSFKKCKEKFHTKPVTPENIRDTLVKITFPQ